MINEAYMKALQTMDPGVSLYEAVVAARDAGQTKKVVETDLTEILEHLRWSGLEKQDDAVRDVLDCVVGFCNPQVRIFP